MAEPERVSPLEGALRYLLTTPEFLTGNHREEAITTELEGIIIDTVIPPDTGKWETGIKRNEIEGKWVIVEQYADEAEAREGHAKWVKLMTDNPTVELEDIDMWSLNR